MQKKWYVGRLKPARIQDRSRPYVPFKSRIAPIEELFSYAFNGVVGPFPDRKTAFVFVVFGENNIHMQHVSDVKRIVKHHPEMYKQAVQEIKHRFGTHGLRVIQHRIDDIWKYGR
jgi:hypothetical protein